MNPDIDVYIAHVKIWQKKTYHACLGLKIYLPRDRFFLKSADCNASGAFLWSALMVTGRERKHITCMDYTICMLQYSSSPIAVIVHSIH